MAKKENKKKIKKEKMNNKSLKEKLTMSKEYLDKSSKGKDDNSISFNFSIKMDKDGIRGGGSFIPPKEMTEEDKENMACLIQKGMQDVNMFMTRAQNEMRKSQRTFEHPFNPLNILLNYMVRNKEDYKYHRRF